MIYFSKEQLEKPDRPTAIKKGKKLNEFERIKERVAFLTGKKEKTEEEFDKYIKSLFDSESCKYMTGIKEIVSLCNNNLFSCKFRSRDNFNFRGRLKFECQREKILRLRKLV